MVKVEVWDVVDKGESDALHDGLIFSLHLMYLKAQSRFWAFLVVVYLISLKILVLSELINICRYVPKIG